MIHYINGPITELSPFSVVIDCNGVGYSVQISLMTFSKIQHLKDCKLFVEHMYLRDAMPKHYGFYDIEERDLFRKLISVSGVGGSAATLMLSSLSTQEITLAINSGNVTLLKSIKGIGDKTAQRIIVDLQGKLGKVEQGMTPTLNLSTNKTKEEALLALTTLGFPKNVSEKALEKAYLHLGGSSDSVEQLLKIALKHM